ncbi:MAG: OmpA family protein [Sphingobacteriia bacterium]
MVRSYTTLANMQLIVLLLLVGIAGSGIHAQTFDKKAERQLLKQADEHLLFQEYEQALPYLQQANGVNADNMHTCYWLGVALFEQGRPTDALPYFELVATRASGFDPGLDYYMAQALHQSSRFEDASIFYQRELGRYKTSDEAYTRIRNQLRQCEQGVKLMKDTVVVEIRNLGPNINTPYPEFGPVITADGARLLFTSRRPGNLGGLAFDNKPYEDIYFSDRDTATGWIPARPLGPPINTVYHDATVSLAPDGQTVMLYRDSNNGGLYSARQQGADWQPPVSISRPINSKYGESSMCLSADGRYAIFASNRPGGLGGRDLYWSQQRPDGSWTDPVNLGPAVNTVFNEDGPFLHPNGRNLYFSSEGHSSMGGYDVFKTTWRPDRTFSAPENLGFPINTPGDDVFFVLDASGRQAYMSSVRPGGYGQDDLYQITWPAPADTLLANQRPEEDAAVPEFNLTLLKGTVRDAETRQPLAATLMIVDNTANDTLSIINSNEETGKYLITLPGGRNYGISAVADGYLFSSENFPVAQASGYQEVVQDLYLEKIRSGKRIVLRNIFFEVNQATLTPESVAELERLLRTLGENARLRVRINGHTDDQGPEDYNLKLSEERAKAVVAWLVANGVATERLAYRGYGEAQPVAENDTEAGRQQNRRTEFEVISND